MPIRAKPIFFALLALAFVSVFVHPLGVPGSRFRPSIGNFFAPVARPVGGLMSWLTTSKKDAVKDDFSPDSPRTVDALRRENVALHEDVASLTAQLKQFRGKVAEMERVGPIKDLCILVNVTGGSAGGGSLMSLGGSTGHGLRENQKALFYGGLVGEIVRASATGADLRPLTATGTRVQASFRRYQQTEDGTIREFAIELPPTLLEGNGTQLAATKLVEADVRRVKLVVGDVAVLDDGSWPSVLAGRRIGRVKAITTAAGAPGFADVRVEPFVDLSQLREVMVLVK